MSQFLICLFNVLGDFECSQEILSVVAMLQVQNVFITPRGQGPQAKICHRKFQVRVDYKIRSDESMWHTDIQLNRITNRHQETVNIEMKMQMHIGRAKFPYYAMRSGFRPIQSLHMTLLYPTSVKSQWTSIAWNTRLGYTSGPQTLSLYQERGAKLETDKRTEKEVV